MADAILPKMLIVASCLSLRSFPRAARVREADHAMIF
jgi:hypothetical protein